VQQGCAGYRKWFSGGIIAQIGSLVNGFLKLLKECIKSLDRFLKNCYDVCSEPKKHAGGSACKARKIKK
jgi:hypothetical protein